MPITVDKIAAPILDNESILSELFLCQVQLLPNCQSIVFGTELVVSMNVKTINNKQQIIKNLKL
ncbi:hypothetical protein FACS189432_05380 [Bacteroidia bacterium]|nr:hypothetical protein FACS189432_05380 [Bacteroidia bacterium]